MTTRRGERGRKWGRKLREEIRRTVRGMVWTSGRGGVYTFTRIIHIVKESSDDFITKKKLMWLNKIHFCKEISSCWVTSPWKPKIDIPYPVYKLPVMSLHSCFPQRLLPPSGGPRLWRLCGRRRSLLVGPDVRGTSTTLGPCPLSGGWYLNRPILGRENPCRSWRIVSEAWESLGPSRDGGIRTFTE